MFYQNEISICKVLENYSHVDFVKCVVDLSYISVAHIICHH